MPESSTGLMSTDPIIARNFYLDLDGEKLILSGVSGLDIELDVANLVQTGKDGKQVHLKTIGGGVKAPDITLTRAAPLNAEQDPIWQWFKAIREKGFKGTDRTSERKNGSIIIYDTSLEEIGRFNFVNGWPSKISTDALSTDSTEPVKETITIVCERMDRVK